MPISEGARTNQALGYRLKIAFVLPRFGERISGGAELLGRWLAERLANAGHEVDVYTTCAIDHASWRNELRPGVEEYRGMRIHRFGTTPRDLGIHGELSLAIVAGYRLSPQEEMLWLRHGGSSEAMEEALSARADRYDLVVALPYLWGTTYFAYAACPAKSVIIPCLHDEPYARLSFVAEMLGGARGLLFNTDVEAELATSLMPRLAPWGVVGVGVESSSDGRRRLRRRRSLPERSILYVGRREEGKNTPLLIDYFGRYRERHPEPVYLALVGDGEAVAAEEGLIEVKPNWDRGSGDTYAAATIVCQPSINESLSIVLLQGWLAGRPALVNGACAVTRWHCERSNGGLWFESYAEFECALERIFGSPTLQGVLGRNGQAYVRREYSWPVVLDRFQAATMQILEGAPRPMTAGKHES